MTIILNQITTKLKKSSKLSLNKIFCHIISANLLMISTALSISINSRFKSNNRHLK